MNKKTETCMVGTDIPKAKASNPEPAGLMLHQGLSLLHLFWVLMGFILHCQIAVHHSSYHKNNIQRGGACVELPLEWKRGKHGRMRFSVLTIKLNILT